MLASGIYAIENTATGEIYIGQAKDITKRWRQHVLGLNKKSHFNRNLQKAWNEHGADAFKFTVLEYCATEQLTEREQHYLDLHTPTGKCYNRARNAHTPSKGHSGAMFENSLTRFSDEEMLKLLNEHKTIEKTAAVIGTSSPHLFKYLQTNGFKKTVTYHYAIEET